MGARWVYNMVFTAVDGGCITWCSQQWMVGVRWVYSMLFTAVDSGCQRLCTTSTQSVSSMSSEVGVSVLSRG